MFNYYCLNPIAQVGLEKFRDNFVKTENVDDIVDIVKNIFGIHSIVIAYKVQTNIWERRNIYSYRWRNTDRG